MKRGPLAGDPVADMADILDAEGIPYAFTGTIAYSVWVTPTATKDVDVIVYASGRARLAKFFQALRHRGLKIDPAAALRDIDTRGCAAVEMPVASGGSFVVEMIYPVLKKLNDQILKRAASVPYPGRKNGLTVVTAEDLVLYKLIFFRKKDKLHIEDVLERHPDFDGAYVLHSLRTIYPETDERTIWFREILDTHGFRSGEAHVYKVPTP